LWSKDIILLFPPDSKTGTQAWVDAYHDAHDANHVSPLPLKSGALQGAIAIDYPLNHRFQAMHIIYDGVNGQLPNLDLINSVVNVAGGQMGINNYIQSMRQHNNKYKHRLQTMLRGMLKQGLGHSAGAHSSFIPYHVDAVTLQPFGRGQHDEMAMGRVIEGSFRSLNNLLEHLHQSFFFYLLMHKDRFVSIGTYLPSAMLLAANFSIMAIFLWVKSGQNPLAKAGEKKAVSPISKGPREAEPSPPVHTVERDFALPVAVVAACHAFSAIPLFLFNHLPADVSISPRTSFVFIGLLTYLLGASDVLRYLFGHLFSTTLFNISASGDIVLTDHSTVSPSQVILVACARDEPFYSSHPQLLSRFHRWTSSCPPIICAANQRAAFALGASCIAQSRCTTSNNIRRGCRI
jgi:glycosylphosphatidylinositol transamidase